MSLDLKYARAYGVAGFRLSASAVAIVACLGLAMSVFDGSVGFKMFFYPVYFLGLPLSTQIEGLAQALAQSLAIRVTRAWSFAMWPLAVTVQWTVVFFLAGLVRSLLPRVGARNGREGR
jgi:ethanolamine transporter EutH